MAKKVKKPKKKTKKLFRFKKSSKMRSDGDIDFDKKIIRINETRSKKHKGGIIDTIVHEDMHRLHPRMSEKNIRKKTTARIKRMSIKMKARLRSKVR